MGKFDILNNGVQLTMDKTKNYVKQEDTTIAEISDLSNLSATEVGFIGHKANIHKAELTDRNISVLDEKIYSLKNTKQATLVSGANIKTIEGQSLLGAGNIDLTKTDVGLNNVDNTADSAKNVLSATKLTTTRTINGVSFDGTANITVADSTKLPLTGGTLTGALSGTTFIGTSFNSITGLSSTTPIVAGTAAVGTGTTAARADHVHGSDTTKASLSGATFTGAVTGTSFNSITNLSSTTPVMNGTAAVGTSTTVARADHVHASDTSRSPLAGSTSITTLGTITTGTWNGTAITDTYLSTISTSGKVSNSATTADSIWASSKKYRK